MTARETVARVAISLVPMAGGWSGIDASMRAMQANVERTLYDQRVREASTAVLHAYAARGGERLEEARAIYRFIEDRVEYRRDPAWCELIQDPRAILAHIEETECREGPGRGWAAGDCDDHAQVAASLGFQVRLPMEFVMTARDERVFTLPAEALLAEFKRAYEEDRPVPIHVYAAMRESKWAESSPEWLAGDDRAPSGLVSLDTARPGAKFGEHAPGLIRYVRPAVLTP